MNTAEIIERSEAIAKERIKDFGLPKWVETECPSCKNKISKEDVLSFEVHFTPIFLGDLSFSYMCKKCNSIFIKHIKCNVKHIYDLMVIFKEESLNYRMDFRETFLNNHEHNAIFMIAEEEKEKNKKPEEVKNG